MGKRRLQVATSSEDEDDKPKQRAGDSEATTRRKRARGLRDAEEDEGEHQGDADKKSTGGEEGEGDDEDQEAVQEDAKPIGDVIRTSGKGRKRKNHYASFEYDGNVFELEDSVLLSPEDKGQKPYVAIIKDITQDGEGNMMVTGQWFYRPEEAEKKGGGSWQTRDTRELFYSFHFDDVPAESVMHKCVVHFVPLHKQLPIRSQHPGFIVQKVYDVVQKRLWKLTDKDYEDNKQHEIDVLVQKTRERLGELPDLETEETSAQQEDQLKSKWNLRRKSIHPIDVSRDETTSKLEQLTKAETPGSCNSDVSEYHAILAKFEVLTGDPYRDKWLEKLLQGIQFVCNSKDDLVTVDKQKNNTAPSKQKITTSDGATTSVTVGESKDDGSEAGERFRWPDAAIQAITALEKVSYEVLGTDFQKYNQKMRQLDFNLKNNALLARRLLNKELEPLTIVNMSPNELKEGLTADEKATNEPEKSDQMQMTDARCSRCMEKKVGVADIIQAGGHGDRYQLECIACGHTWYAARDAISSLTIDAPNVVGNVGTAPWATAKFENVAKKLVSPRESQKPAADIFHKSTTAYMPVLETQKSFNRSKNEDPSVPAANRE